MSERSSGGGWTLGLIGLWAFAVAQPLLDLISRGPEFLLAHGLSGLEIALGALLLTIGVPAIVGGALELLARPMPRLAAGLALGCAGALLFAQSVQIGNALDLGPRVTLTAALASALALTWLIHRLRGLPGASVALGLCALVFVLKFAFFTPVRGLLLPGSSSAQLTAVAEPRDVVLIVFDELPTGSLLNAVGEIDRSRFPAFARLAAAATFFPNATAVHFSTSHAVPAILTGRVPDRRRLPTHLDHPHNLFTWLEATHEVHAVETLTALCPATVCESPAAEHTWRRRLASLGSDLEILFLHHLLPEAWRGGLPPVTGTWRDFRRTVRPPGRNDVVGEEWSARYDVTAKVDSLLEGLARAGSPSLHYLHLELPHIPWRYLPDGREYGPISGSNFAHGAAAGDGRWVGSDWEITQALQRHLLQLAYADRLLGRILDAVDRRFADALLIVTADHGLSFVAGEPGRRPENENVGEVLSVPLLIRDSGRVARVDSRPAQTTDLVATLAAAQGAQPPWTAEGVDLFGEAEAQRPAVYVGTDGWARRTLSNGQVTAAVARAAARIFKRFPRPGVAGLFEIGPRAELLGRPAADLPSRAGDRRTALEQSWLLSRVEPGSEFLPAQVQGRIFGPDPSPETELVVAVNGLLSASSRPYVERELWHVSAMLPPESLERGLNRIEIFEVVPGDDGLELVSWGGSAEARYSIERDDAGRPTGLRAADGSVATIRPGAVPGRLLRQGSTFWGWAHDAAFERRTVVMAFAAGELVYATPTNQRPEPGTSPPAAPNGMPIGFRFALPRSLVSSPERVELFAVAGDRASILEP